MRFLTLIFTIILQTCIAQVKEVSITIDDVPNTRIYQEDAFKSVLLDRIDVMNIPVTIFINEKHIYNTSFESKNLLILERWLKTKNITAGNHSYSHINYADTTLAGFQQDIVKGELLTTKIIGHRPTYFRFPFNSLGNDSIQHMSIRKFLREKGYIHAPFTIESEDWAYNTLYENALRNNDNKKAKQIGEQYVAHTLSLFQYFEKVSKELYKREIRHIYLCHDNRLNTDYLEMLVNGLKERGYSFISLEKALEDKVYESREYYFGRYGFSWIYRWEPDSDKRKMMMRKEPTDETFRAAYEALTNQK